MEKTDVSMRQFALSRPDLEASTRGADVATERRLRTPLLLNGIWSIIAGLLLFFPSVGAAVFAYQLKDAAAVSGWGVVVITIGLLAWVAASDVEKYGGLAWVFAFGLLLGAVDLVFFWVGGAYTARNVLVPVIINLVLAAWIWLARPRE